MNTIRCRRRAVTLLEALLATVILAGALASLSQLATNGINAALRIEVETIAATKCQTKLDDLLSKSEVLSVGQELTFNDDSDWTWQADLSPGPTESLLLLTVTVRRHQQSRPKFSYRLSRLIDGQLFSDNQSTATLGRDA